MSDHDHKTIKKDINAQSGLLLISRWSQRVGPSFFKHWKVKSTRRNKGASQAKWKNGLMNKSVHANFLRYRHSEKSFVLLLKKHKCFLGWMETVRNYHLSAVIYKIKTLYSY